LIKLVNTLEIVTPRVSLQKSVNIEGEERKMNPMVLDWNRYPIPALIHGL
jgi:hypothetical protein